MVVKRVSESQLYAILSELQDGIAFGDRAEKDVNKLNIQLSLEPALDTGEIELVARRDGRGVRVGADGGLRTLPEIAPTAAIPSAMAQQIDEGLSHPVEEPEDDGTGDGHGGFSG